MSNEAFVSKQYIVTKKDSQVDELQGIKGVQILDVDTDADISLIELTEEGSLASLLQIRRRGYLIDHPVIGSPGLQPFPHVE